jgi:hypothetical protein
MGELDLTGGLRSKLSRSEHPSAAQWTVCHGQERRESLAMDDPAGIRDLSAND